METNNGKYLYGLIEAKTDKKYISRGVEGSSPVYTVRHKDVGAIISDLSQEIVKATLENCALHEKVLEEAMRETTVLPFEFGTVSPGGEAVTNLIKNNYINIKKSINYLRDKMEMGVQARWAGMEKIFQEIVSENRHIALYKKSIEKKSPNETYQDRIKIGQLVAQALYVKKEKEIHLILTALKRGTLGYVPEKIVGDNMIFNGAFLVRKTNLARFESILYSLGHKLDDRIDFTYTGPLPPYNFTNLTLKIRG